MKWKMAIAWFVPVSLLLGQAAQAETLKQFSYCGEIRIQSPAGGGAMMMPGMPAGMMPATWISAVGPAPTPPHSCAYVRLGKAEKGKYTPTIVIWSDGDMPVPHHADIYSDAHGIWGHRQSAVPGMASGVPDDPAVVRDMEAFLQAAAGPAVLKRVLEALRNGRDHIEFDGRDSAGPGGGAPVGLHYSLKRIRANPAFPSQVKELMRKARQHLRPHGSQWKVIIQVPVGWVGGEPSRR